jgi:hypothetical protein
MTAELERDAELEIGHVLFMDIVGFSKLLVDEQSDCSDRLNHIVRRTSQFRAAEPEGKLIRLPPVAGSGRSDGALSSCRVTLDCRVYENALKKSRDYYTSKSPLK